MRYRIEDLLCHRNIAKSWLCITVLPISRLRNTGFVQLRLEVRVVLVTE